MHSGTAIPSVQALEIDNENEASALRSTHAVASVGIATLNMLETLLPTAAVEVEKESKALSDYFMRLIKSTKQQTSIIQEIGHEIGTFSLDTLEFPLHALLNLLAIKLSDTSAKSIAMDSGLDLISAQLGQHMSDLHALANDESANKDSSANGEAFRKKVSRVSNSIILGMAQIQRNIKSMRMGAHEAEACENDIRNTSTLIGDIERRQSTYNQLIEQARLVDQDIKTASDGVVTCMQFQDRNTQIMQNVVGILERYRSMLQDICGNIEMMRNEHIAGSHQIAQAVEDILSGICLSDIRTQYMDALKKAKVPTHGKDNVLSGQDGNTENVVIF